MLRSGGRLSEVTLTEVQKLIAEECDAIKALLLAKNLKYGNSAISPLNIFSHTAATEQIRVRIDDKLSRIRNMGTLAEASGAITDEDTVKDLIGYLVLYRIAERLELAKEEEIFSEHLETIKSDAIFR